MFTDQNEINLRCVNKNKSTSYQGIFSQKIARLDRAQITIQYNFLFIAFAWKRYNNIVFRMTMQIISPLRIEFQIQIKLLNRTLFHSIVFLLVEFVS